MPKWHAFLSLISKIIQTERKIKGEKIKKKNTNKNNPLQSCDQLTNVMRVAFGREMKKTSEKAMLFKLVLKTSKSAVFSLVRITGVEPA